MVDIFTLLNVNTLCERFFNVIGALNVFYFEQHFLNKFIPYRPLKINIFIILLQKLRKATGKKTHTGQNM
jgi:hypothetical protein